MDFFGSEQALMDNLMEEEDHSFYWETKRWFFENEELDSGMGFDDPIADYYGSSSPEGGTSSSTGAGGLPKNIVMERKRRQLVNERLYALRGVVPNITKMDKASIIKDAIDYIQLLQEQEKRMSAEISQLEMINMTKEGRVALLPICDEDAQVLNFEKGKKRTQAKSSHLAKSPIEVIKLKVNQTGEKTLLISISCSKKEETMIKICELFEILNLKVMTANITSVSTSLLHTMLVESNEMNSTQVKEKMEGAIAELNAQNSPVTSMSV